jgi:AraC family transcriptional regulator
MYGSSNFATALAAANTAYPLRPSGCWQVSAPASQPRKSVGSLQTWRLRRVIELVEANIEQPLALAALARAAGLSRMHFAAQFRQATGLRPHEYVLRRRIERAKEMLAMSALAIAEVALQVGFSSQGHFTAVFKRFTGMTPYRWRCAFTAADDARPISRPKFGGALPNDLSY